MCVVAAALVLPACSSSDPIGTSVTGTSHAQIPTTAQTVPNNEEPTTDPDLVRLLSTLEASLRACDGDRACIEDVVDAAYRDCMELRGFLTVQDSDGIWVTHDGGTPDAYREATSGCFMAVAGVLPSGPPADRDWFSAYYDFLVELMECVREQGHPVPDPPSREVFIDTEGATWHPYDPRWTPPTVWDSLEKICPQDFQR